MDENTPKPLIDGTRFEHGSMFMELVSSGVFEIGAGGLTVSEARLLHEWLGRVLKDHKTTYPYQDNLKTMDEVSARIDILLAPDEHYHDTGVPLKLDERSSLRTSQVDAVARRAQTKAEANATTYTAKTAPTAEMG